MSVQSTILGITQQEAAYTPAVIAAVQAAEASGAAGATKKQAVIDAIIAGSRQAESVSNPNVAAIAAMVDLTVSIFNITGLFSRKPKAATTQKP